MVEKKRTLSDDVRNELSAGTARQILIYGTIWGKYIMRILVVYFSLFNSWMASRISVRRVRICRTW